MGMVVCKNRRAKNDWGIEEGVVGGDCTDGFVSKDVKIALNRGRKCLRGLQGWLHQKVG